MIEEIDQEKREILIWLAGLISTDGCIYKRKNREASFNITVTTAERKWAEQMQEVLKQAEINSTIYSYINEHHYGKTQMYTLSIKEPRRILRLLREIEDYFLMGRKRKIIDSVSLSNLNTNFWSKIEEEYLLKNYKPIGEYSQKESSEALDKLVEELGKSRMAISEKYRKLREDNK